MIGRIANLASLDPISQAQVWRRLLAAVRTRDIGVLAISHDRPLLDAVADRVVDLADLSEPSPAETSA